MSKNDQAKHLIYKYAGLMWTPDGYRRVEVFSDISQPFLKTMVPGLRGLLNYLEEYRTYRMGDAEWQEICQEGKGIKLKKELLADFEAQAGPVKIVRIRRTLTGLGVLPWLKFKM